MSNSSAASSLPGLKPSTTSAAASGESRSFGLTLGPQLIGGLLALALWGVICLQMFTYLVERPRDQVAFRATIVGLWLLDTYDSASIIYILYYYLVINFMNPSRIAVFIWSDIVHIIITTLSNFVIRVLFMVKIYQLSKKNLWLTGLLVALSLLDLATGILVTVETFRVSSYFTTGRIFEFRYLHFSSQTASDVSVAVTLSILLYRSKTGFDKTDGTVRVLMFYVINTGMLGAVVAALGMTFRAVMPHNLIYLIPSYCLSKLYLSAYLAMLNARQGLREKLAECRAINDFSGLSQCPTSGGSTTLRGSRSRPERLAIFVQTESKVEEEVERLPMTRRAPGRAF
ncbi:hypothetical protein APHAL10511_005197 [Amanita phalloides]|nr:hypothetical protein APHAL10511_005197 [Amanita phalloides]